MRRGFLSILLAFLLPAMCWAQSFKVEDIRVDGLQRLELGTVLRGLNIEIGEEVDEYRLAAASRNLFSLGYFNDIQLLKDGNLLVVKVAERPALSRIKLEGNDVIESEQLLQGLATLGLEEGEIFQRATLERIRIELSRLYSSKGRYNVWIDTELEELPENRVGLNIKIKEGSAASIRHINIVGNEVYADDELRELFELDTPGFWSFIFKDDLYNREKFGGDLERLRSHYLNNGYINFNIESTQVSITPDREHVYLTINVKEGERYYFGKAEITGRLPEEAEVTLDEKPIQAGDVFSREKMVATAESLSDQLGRYGYLRANVNPVPKIDEATKTVDLQYFVDPGLRLYVRRIGFKGNSSSADEVLRREMRQMEGAWASSEKIEQSKTRLEKLGYYKSVNVQTKQVPAAEDQVDLEYSVVEQLSGTLAATIGYSNSDGIVLGARVSQRNFLGTGKHVSFAVNNSSSETEYSFSYTDPYHTIDGVSRGFDVYYREEDFDEDDISDYSVDTFGGNVDYSYPIDENQRIGFKVGYEHSEFTLGSTDIPAEITEFIDTEGDKFDQYILTGTWSDNHLNRGLLASAGYSQSASIELHVPGSDLTFYKLRHRWQQYWPISDDGWIFKLGTRLGYAEAYGDTEDMPFYKNFYSGGFSSVRGFKNNSLGPRADNADQDPLGGNVQIEGTVELIFPVPFVDDQSSMRTLFFLDAGNVFETSCREGNPYCVEGIEFDEMRASVGFGLSWLTFIGPLSFSLATPVVDKPGDKTETFQFTLGRTF